MKTFAPILSLLFSAHILPPWASMILLEINNPKPVSSFDFETNIEHNLGNISGSIPVPVSFTVTITSSRLASLPPLFVFALTKIVPSRVNLIALLNRMDKT